MDILAVGALIQFLSKVLMQHEVSREYSFIFKSNGGIFIVLSDRHDNNMRLIKRQFAYVHYRKLGSWQ